MAAISRADGLVGELVDTLKRVGLYDDTVIVIAADHGGGQTGTHGRDAEPLRNVPFIISGPGILQNKTIDEREVRIFDVGATVVEVFGFSRPESWIATPVYEVFRSYVPPVAPPSSSPRITYVSEYQHVYDTSGELNAFLSTFSIWRVRSIFFFFFPKQRWLLKPSYTSRSPQRATSPWATSSWLDTTPPRSKCPLSPTMPTSCARPPALSASGPTRAFTVRITS